MNDSDGRNLGMGRAITRRDFLNGVAAACTDQAMDQAYRAVQELVVKTKSP